MLEATRTGQSESSNSEIFLGLYGAEIDKSTAKLDKMGAFLSEHNVDEGLRARMLDWMTEVISSYRF